MSRTKKSRKSHGSIKSIASLVFSIGLAGASLLVWANKQAIVDWVSYYQFQPDSKVMGIADRTTMVDKGKFLFYASKPVVENATEFNKSCERKEASSAILGCYSENRIFVYDIANEQLDGIKEVTAAHEMLHAAYQRMSGSEKETVNALLEKEYDKAKSDKELAERMAFYDKYEAGERYNELHSIVGTEFSSLDPALEEHYKQYFSDRATVVALHNKYASVFTALKNKSDQLLAQLKSLGPKIESESSSYNAAVKQLNSDIQSFNTKATSGGFTSQAEFNSDRQRLTQRADSLDTLRAQIDADLSTYEKARQEYNSTASTSNNLYKSMDSKLAPSPSV